MKTKYQNINILIIEDNKNINTHFENLGFECTYTNLSNKTYSLIKNTQYDYVFIYIDTFSKNKDLFIEEINNLNNVKLIIISSCDKLEQKEFFLEMGIFDYLLKDKFLELNIKKLITKIENNKFSFIAHISDNNILSKRIDSILTLRNYNLKSINTLEKFYELEKNQKIDLLILDLDIKSFSSLEFLKKIKNNLDIKIPIIVLSQLKTSSLYSTCMKNGVSDIILNPFIKEELISKIDFVLESTRYKNNLQSSNKLLAQYKNTVDVSSIVSKTNAKGIITYVNEEFEKISGYKKEELIGKSHNIIRHPDMPSSTFEEIWKTIKKDKKPWSGKVKNLKKDGSSYYVNTVMNPIVDDFGNIIEYIAIRNDITKIEESKKQYQKQYALTSDRYEEVLTLAKLYEYAMEKSNIVLRLNLNKEITYINQAFCDISGYSKEELIGKKYSYIKHPDTNDKEIEELWNTIESGKIWKGPLKNISKIGKAYHSVATVVPIKNKNAEIIEYMSIRQDITEIINLHQEIEDTQKEIIYKIGEIGESRSKETGHHVKRVAGYSKLLALKLGLSLKEAEILEFASPMHDIGKIAIPDAILNKPAILNNDEFEVMRTHAKLGFEMLNNSERTILKASAIIAYEHHERWDGKGYPRRLKGENIHIYGRITAVADVFDALGSKRCYKEAWELDKIIDLFKEERAKQFDPKIIDIFLSNLDEFLEIREKFN